MDEQPDNDQRQRIREHYRAELDRVARISAGARDAEVRTVQEIAAVRRRRAA